ncbi:toxin-antitoxin system YwqK family antitoxin [Aquimarina rhabdastrellae]
MKAVLMLTTLLLTIVSQAQKINQFDENGERHGKWMKRYDNSPQIRYEGTFEHGKEIGEFKFYKPKSGKQPTAIKIFSKNTDSVTVTYYTQKGVVISKGKMIAKNREGLWTYYHLGGKKVMMTEIYKEGKLNGPQETFFTNGKPTEKVTYINGKREGKKYIYSDEGVVLKEFTYESDKLNGITKYYNSEGVVTIEGTYRNDKKHGIWNYYKNGKLTEQKLFPLKKKGH